METELLAGLGTVSTAAVALAVALIRSMRSSHGDIDEKMTTAQTAIVTELRAMNSSLGRIEGHQEAFAASQARTAEALAYWKGRMDGAPAQPS